MFKYYLYMLATGIAVMWGLAHMEQANTYSYKGEIGKSIPEGILERSN